MGTRRNLANLSFRSGATRGTEVEFGRAMAVPFWLRLARGKMVQAKRETAAANRGHLEGMAGAFYQSLSRSMAGDLYARTAMGKDNRNLFSRPGFDRTMRESFVARCRTPHSQEA